MSAPNPTPLFGAVAQQLTENGYRVVPVHFGSKKPIGNAWQRYVYKPADRKRHATAGVGILCGEIAPIDIDVRVEALVRHMEALANDMLGAGAAPRRVGFPPKVLIPMRSEVPFLHVATRGYHFPGDAPGSKPHRVEILGVGQQFVSHNIHEDTGKPYEWNGAGDPLTIRSDQLPTLVVARVPEFLAACEQLLAAVPGARPAGKLAEQDEGREHKPNEELLARDPALLRQALAAIPNNDIDYYEWVHLLYAAKGALGDAGVDAFLAWSAQSSKDRPEYSAYQYRMAQPRKYGAGTIYYFAKVNGWTRAPAASARIEVRAGELPRMVREAEDALLAQDCGIYQRGGALARVVQLQLDVADKRRAIKRSAGSSIIGTVTREYLMLTLARAADWLKWNAKEKALRKCDPPDRVVSLLGAASGEWRLPALTGLTAAPTLRADGTLLDRPGYDAATGLFGVFDPADFPGIDPRPTRAQALAALDTLRQLFGESAFEGGAQSAHAAVALAATITACLRHSLKKGAPIFGFSAPKIGSGKTTAAQAATQVATGYVPAVLSWPNNEIELRKSLLSVLLAGDTAVLIDNIEAPVKSATLCAIITSDTYKDRLLGTNLTTAVSTAVTWFLTGNGLEVVGDLTSRTLLCLLDAEVERPEEREFKHDLGEYIAGHRGALLCAALTIPLAYLAAGAPAVAARPSRFKDWDRLVRRPLLSLGVADPLDTQIELRGNDPEREGLVGLLRELRTAFADEPFTVARLTLEAAALNLKSRPGLFDAVRAVAAEKAGGVDHRALGRYLKRHIRRIEDGMRLEDAGEDPLTHNRRYRIYTV